MADFSTLTLRGRIATPEDSDWDESRQAWNLAADQHPEGVAFVESADDVSQVINFARQNGRRAGGQWTGQGAGAMGSLEGTVPIKTLHMRGILIGDGTARVEAGVLAEE